jgi:hypothetical protein
VNHYQCVASVLHALVNSTMAWDMLEVLAAVEAAGRAAISSAELLQLYLTGGGSCCSRLFTEEPNSSPIACYRKETGGRIQLTALQSPGDR